jgi:hypothetical protein
MEIKQLINILVFSNIEYDEKKLIIKEYLKANFFNLRCDTLFHEQLIDEDIG